MAKRLITLILALGLALGVASAASRDVIVFEDFSSGTFPPAGWTISSNAANWSLFAGANAGGTLPELRFGWSPQFSGSSYFISPSFDTSGFGSVLIDFRHFVDHYDSPMTVGVATRSNGGAWNSVWSESPDGNVGPELQTVAVTNADVGSATFQFAFYFSGSSYNIDYWYVDNVKLYTPFPYDLAVTSTLLPTHVSSGTSITPICVVKNAGLNPLTALVSLNVYRGDVLEASHPDYFSAYQNPNDAQTVSFPDFTPALDNENYRFAFSVSSLEDVVDSDLANNNIEGWVNTWTGTKQMVLLEIGTGAWCTYCPGAAMAADDFVDGGYNVAVVENHNGDPYATDTSNARNTYYGISGYPTGFFDGTLSYVGGNHSTSVFPAYLPLYEQRNVINTPFNLGIYGEQTRENYQITLQVDKLAPVSYPNLAVHLALTESHIQYSWQGQTELNFVNRGMFPSWEGTVVDLAGAPLGITNVPVTVTKDPSWVNAQCEFVAWIQDLNTKEVLQANKVMLSELTAPPVATDDSAASPLLTSLAGISPNPFSATASIAYSVKDSAPVTISVYNLKGQLVKTLVSAAKTAGSHSVNWDGRDSQGNRAANGAYIVKLNSGNASSVKKLMLIR